ncbi:auxin-responsive protein SAUR68 [Ziziphus jujuba]|uniref:Auxin-responsive protein SAUR68 n=1 Tax=Ziziphus jujuba TaxID=326968 RepID=A0A6P4ADD8_ZIZJJ|nr:auxin-responsive protein SAUR68 [Ziziphus jujuba]
MISAKKLIKMARKWQKLATLSRKRILFPRNNEDLDAESTSNSSSIVEKGHFVVYTADHKRFVMPLSYLSSNILRELFKMSEEEFGLPSDRPITLPCDAIFMEYVVALIRRGATKDVEKALLKSINAGRCSSSSSYHQGFASLPLLVYGY